MADMADDSNWRSWTLAQTAAWVASQGPFYAKYKDAFLASEIKTGTDLQDLDDELLCEMIGMDNHLHRRRLLTRIRYLVKGLAVPPPSPPRHLKPNFTFNSSSPTSTPVSLKSAPGGRSVDEFTPPLHGDDLLSISELFAAPFDQQSATQGRSTQHFLSNSATGAVGLEALHGKVVGLYFGAHWCESCEVFTPLLATIYRNLQQAQWPNFEVIYISFKDEEEYEHERGSSAGQIGAEWFEASIAKMPWLALPYTDISGKQHARRFLGVKSIPTLVIWDTNTGTILNRNACDAVRLDSPDGLDFPWRQKREQTEQLAAAEQIQALYKQSVSPQTRKKAGLRVSTGAKSGRGGSIQGKQVSSEGSPVHMERKDSWRESALDGVLPGPVKADITRGEDAQEKAAGLQRLLQNANLVKNVQRVARTSDEHYYARLIQRRWRRCSSAHSPTPSGSEPRAAPLLLTRQRSASNSLYKLFQTTSGAQLLKDKQFHSGAIRFFRNRAISGPDPYFIRVSQNTPVGELHKLMTSQAPGWGLESHPSLLVSVTGSALGNIKLRPKYFQTFADGLMRATMNTNAWIITGGTDTGIMRSIGDMQALHSGGRDSERVLTPCIGIATWGCVKNRQQLTEENLKVYNEKGKRQTYHLYDNTDDEGDTEGALLNPNHSHFILVDSGNDVDRAKVGECKAPWGDEIPMRTSFEDYVCHCRHEHDQRGGWTCYSDSGWAAYPKYVSDALTKAKKAGKECHSFTRFDNEYTVTFADMTQTNDSTKYKRQVREPGGTLGSRGGQEHAHSRKRDPQKRRATKHTTPRHRPYHHSHSHSPHPKHRKRTESEQLISPAQSKELERYAEQRDKQANNEPLTPRSDKKGKSRTRTKYQEPRRKRLSMMHAHGSMSSITSDTEVGGGDKDDVEHEHEEEQQVPSVMLVYSGGPGTFKTMEGGVKNHTPLILVKESGRAVDAVQQYYFDDEHDEELLRKMFKGDAAKIATAKQQIEHIVERGQIYFYDVTGESGTGASMARGDESSPDSVIGAGLAAEAGDRDDLDFAYSGDETSSDLLHLITLSLVRNDHLSNNVKMCMLVRWNSAPSVRALLATKPIEEDRMEPALDEELLVYAAYHDHGRMFLELFWHGYTDKLLDGLIKRELGVLRRRSVSAKTHRRHGAAFADGSLVADEGGSTNGESSLARSNDWEQQWKSLHYAIGNVTHSVPSLFRNLPLPHRSTSARDLPGEQPYIRKVAALGGEREPQHGLGPAGGGLRRLSVFHRLYWSIVTERVGMLRALWQASPYPVAAALFISLICRRLASESEISGQGEKFQRIAEQYDQLAYNVLDMVPDFEQAAAILTSQHGCEQHVADKSSGMAATRNATTFDSDGSGRVSFHSSGECRSIRCNSNNSSNAANSSREDFAALLPLIGGDALSDGFNRIDLAIRAQNRRFLAHRYVQRHMDHVWTVELQTYVFRHLVAYVVFLIAYAWSILVVQLPGGLDEGDSFAESGVVQLFLVSVLCVYIFCYAADELDQLAVLNNDFSEYFRGSNNQLDLTIVVLFCVSQSCNLLCTIMLAAGWAKPTEADSDADTISGNGGADSSMTTMIIRHSANPWYELGILAYLSLSCLNIMVCVSRFLAILSLYNKELGILFLTTKTIIINDVSVFYLFFSIILVGFMPASYFFFPHKRLSSAWGSLIWTSLGNLELSDFARSGDGPSAMASAGPSEITATICGNFTSNTTASSCNMTAAHLHSPSTHGPDAMPRLTEVKELEAGLSFAASLFVMLFFTLTTVILMNLLIAMMSSTYEDIYNDADLRWKALRVLMVKEYEDMAGDFPYPPPMNVFKVVADIRDKLSARLNTYISASDTSGSNSGHKNACASYAPVGVAKRVGEQSAAETETTDSSVVDDLHPAGATTSSSYNIAVTVLNPVNWLHATATAITSAYWACAYVCNFCSWGYRASRSAYADAAEAMRSFIRAVFYLKCDKRPRLWNSFGALGQGQQAGDSSSHLLFILQQAKTGSAGRELRTGAAAVSGGIGGDVSSAARASLQMLEEVQNDLRDKVLADEEYQAELEEKLSDSISELPEDVAQKVKEVVTALTAGQVQELVQGVKSELSQQLGEQLRRAVTEAVAATEERLSHQLTTVRGENAQLRQAVQALLEKFEHDPFDDNSSEC